MLDRIKKRGYNNEVSNISRNIAQPGSAPALGAGGRKFKSCYSDHLSAGIAQLVERQPSKLNVASSNLVSRSKKYYGDRSSVGRAPVCGTGCREFEPRRSPHLRH